MQYLQVKNLHKTFTDKALLDGVSFSIVKGQKVALVARNGAGKSTLLNILMAKLQQDDGSVQFHKDIRVGFLSQLSDIPAEISVLDALFEHDSDIGQLIRKYEAMLIDPGADQTMIHQILEEIEQKDAREYEVKVKTIISQLQLNSLLHKTIGSLSGGELKRVSLAKTLIEEPHFLILDEPTNHLDLEMIEWLEKYLKKSDLTLLLVTHDRYFLARVCTDIYELDKGKIYTYPGNYEKFMEKKAERLENESTSLHHLKMLYKQELYRVRKRPRARGRKSVGRTKAFTELEMDYKQKKATASKESAKLELSIENRRLGTKVLKVHGLQKAYGEKIIVKNFKHDFMQGERVGIVGKNGVGKSTFVNMIAGIEQPDKGDMEWGPTVRLGYYQQNNPIPDSQKTVLEYVKDFAEYIFVATGVKLTAKQLLERFLFSGKQLQSRVYSLSGGERRRLHLLTILISSPNVLILDEPTNDLDIETMAILEDFLLSYQGCLIIISHDRFFMDKLVDHLFVFQGNGEMLDYWGTYTEYKLNEHKPEEIEKKRGISLDDNSDEEIRREKKSSEETDGDDTLNGFASLAMTVAPKKLSYNEKREFEQLGVDIQKLDQRKEEINLMFQEEGLETEKIVALGKELSEIVGKLEVKEARWLELAERE